MRVVALIMLIISTIVSFAFGDTGHIGGMLLPDARLTNTLKFTSTRLSVTMFFPLCDMKPESPYEVRVSYPGTAPVTVQLALLHAEPQGPSRRLLDTEKVMFRTDSHGQIEDARIFTGPDLSSLVAVDATAPIPLYRQRFADLHCAHIVRLQVSYSGVTDLTSVVDQPVPFHIVLETLYLGGAPLGVVKIALLVLPLLIFGFWGLRRYGRAMLLALPVSVSEQVLGQRAAPPLPTDSASADDGDKSA